MENNLAVLIPGSTKFDKVYFCAEQCEGYIKVGYITGEDDFTQEEETTLSGYLNSMTGADLSPAYFKENNYIFKTLKTNNQWPIKVTTKGNGSYYIFPPFEVMKGGTKEFYDFVCNNK